MSTYRRVVMTRQLEQGKPWVDRLTQSGLKVLELPLLCFESLDVSNSLLSEPMSDNFDWILFTSPNGVRTFIEAGLKPGRCRSGALGTGTQAALIAAGFLDNANLPHNDGADFGAAFVAAFPAPGRVLLPGPVERRYELQEALVAAGFQTQILDLYRTVSVEPGDLPDQPFTDGDVVFFCSPSAVKAFTAKWTERPDAVAIGKTTARALDDIKYSHRVATAPDLESMVQAAGLPWKKPLSKTE